MEFVPGPDLTVAAEPMGPGTDDQMPRHLSPSSSSIYNQCPRKWQHRYVDRLPDPPGPPALIGTFAHLVLEHLMQAAPGQRSKDAAKVLARRLWPEIEADDDYQQLDLDETEAHEFRWRSWQAIEGLWALENPDETLVHATEQEMQVNIGEVPFRGIIDRLDIIQGQIVISDYKSGKAPSERFSHDALRQVLYYAAAVHATDGVTPLGAQLLYLGQRKLKVRVNQARLAQAADELHATWESLTNDCQTGDFAARTGPLCAWCPFVNQCPEGQAEVRQRNDEGRVRVDAPGLAVVLAEAG